MQANQDIEFNTYVNARLSEHSYSIIRNEVRLSLMSIFNWYNSPKFKTCWWQQCVLDLVQAAVNWEFWEKYRLLKSVKDDDFLIDDLTKMLIDDFWVKI